MINEFNNLKILKFCNLSILQSCNQNSGQVMLLAVLLMSITLIGVVSISGYLLTQQLRITTNIVESTKAIFAANSGMEYEAYKFFCGGPCDSYDPLGPTHELSNGSKFDASRVDVGLNTTITSNGWAGRGGGSPPTYSILRILQIKF